MKYILISLFFFNCFGKKNPNKININLPKDHYSYIIQDLSNESVIESHQKEKLFPTASIIKILTGFYALKKLGPNFKFDTKLCADNKVENGTLNSDLAIKGSGDPSFVTENMIHLVHKLKLMGLKKIDGNLIYDDTVFEPFELKSGRKKLSTTRPYNAHLGGLNLNYNSIPVHFYSNGHISMDGPQNYYSLKKGNSKGSPSLKFQSNNLVASGSTRKNEQIEYIRADNPSLFFMYTLKERLNDQGISISGKILSKKISRCKEFMTVQSRPLEEIVKLMNKYSNNIIAEALIKKIDSLNGSSGSLDSGLKGMSNFYKKYGFTKKNLNLVTSSGLNPKNTASAQSFNNFLINIISKDILSNTLFASFPIAGHDGTLQKTSKLPFTGKTGTLNNVSTISGIYKNKKSYVVTLMINTKNKSFSQLHKIRTDFLKQLGQL